MHVVFELTNYQPAICVLNMYALCVTQSTFALWLSMTSLRYADKWAAYATYNFPSWSPTVDHDGRVVLKFTNKVYTNMVPGENGA